MPLREPPLRVQAEARDVAFAEGLLPVEARAFVEFAVQPHVRTGVDDVGTQRDEELLLEQVRRVVSDSSQRPRRECRKRDRLTNPAAARILSMIIL